MKRTVCIRTILQIATNVTLKVGNVLCCGWPISAHKKKKKVAICAVRGCPSSVVQMATFSMKNNYKSVISALVRIAKCWIFHIFHFSFSNKKRRTNENLRVKNKVTHGSGPTPLQKRIFWRINSSRSEPHLLPCTGQVRSGQEMRFRFLNSISIQLFCVIAFHEKMERRRDPAGKAALNRSTMGKQYHPKQHQPKGGWGPTIDRTSPHCKVLQSHETELNLLWFS